MRTRGRQRSCPPWKAARRYGWPLPRCGQSARQRCSGRRSPASQDGTARRHFLARLGALLPRRDAAGLRHPWGQKQVDILSNQQFCQPGFADAGSAEDQRMLRSVARRQRDAAFAQLHAVQQRIAAAGAVKLHRRAQDKIKPHCSSPLSVISTG